MKYSGDLTVSMGGGAGPLQFAGPLRVLNGGENWCLVLYALPPGKSYEDVVGLPVREFLQAAGRADRMTVEICKGGGNHGAWSGFAPSSATRMAQTRHSMC